MSQKPRASGCAHKPEDIFGPVAAETRKRPAARAGCGAFEAAAGKRPIPPENRR